MKARIFLNEYEGTAVAGGAKVTVRASLGKSSHTNFYNEAMKQLLHEPPPSRLAPNAADR